MFLQVFYTAFFVGGATHIKTARHDQGLLFPNNSTNSSEYDWIEKLSPRICKRFFNMMEKSDRNKQTVFETRDNLLTLCEIRGFHLE